MIRVNSERSDKVMTLRLPSEMKQCLVRAAHANNKTLTDFVLDHAWVAADRVLAQHQEAA